MALLSVYRKIRMHTTSQSASRTKLTAFAALSQRDRKARRLSGRMFYYRSPIILPQGRGKTLHPKYRKSLLTKGSLFPLSGNPQVGRDQASVRERSVRPQHIVQVAFLIEGATQKLLVI